MQEKTIHCSNPHCENEIATVVEIEGREMIKTGGLLVSRIDGACLRCGMKFYWAITEKMMEKIIENMRKVSKF